MKDSTLQTLITARALLEQAERHCSQGDRYLATAGLIVLQDAFELILYAVLLELGVDETKKLEGMDFDSMLGEIGKNGIKVPKSGSLKAMNKLRVTAKHYGQIMEPITVQNHFTTAVFAIDAILQAAIGKPLREIFLTELVGDIPAKGFLEESVRHLEKGEFCAAMIATRKAFYLEFEIDYCLHGITGEEVLKDLEVDDELRSLFDYKAPSYAYNAKWLELNIKTPCDYVKIDDERWRLDALEWGINTQALSNIRRLTPSVIRIEEAWFIQYPPNFTQEGSIKGDALMCFDLTVEAIRQKRAHQKSAKFGRAFNYKLTETYVGSPVYKKASVTSKVLGTVTSPDILSIIQVVDGFDGDTFFHIFGEGQFGFVKLTGNDLASRKAGTPGKQGAG